MDWLAGAIATILAVVAVVVSIGLTFGIYSVLEWTEQWMNDVREALLRISPRPEEKDEEEKS